MTKSQKRIAIQKGEAMPVDNVREKFEATCKADYRINGIQEEYFEVLLKFVDGEYVHKSTALKWIGYQAAHAESVQRISTLVLSETALLEATVRQAARIAELEQKLANYENNLIVISDDSDGLVAVSHAVAGQLIGIRDALVSGNNDDAYHFLYCLADPNFCSTAPWETLEQGATAITNTGDTNEPN